MNFLKNKIKFLIFPVVFFGAIFFSSYLFAYDETIVHPSLTEEMAKLYNKNYADNELTAGEIRSMRKGSTDEDKSVVFAIRSSNHFYNPLGVKGWIDDTAKKEIVPSQGMISKAWAHNASEQSLFPGGDFTWERAIADYANGDKVRAYEGLGHILHLLEDATVPAHVRSDLHISPKEFEAKKDTYAGKLFLDYEPYESWTGSEASSGRLKFDFAKNLIDENKKPVIRQAINEYFDEVALYTNKGFFSKDTIYTYSEPNNKIFEGGEKTDSGKIKSYVYKLDEYGQKVKLAGIFENTSNGQRDYILDDTTPDIHVDYWSRLGSKAVLEGAGVIKLFKDEAEKAAKNSQTANRSWLVKNISKYSYGFYSGILENGGTVVKNEVTLGTLLGNGIVYTATQVAQGIKSSAIAAYSWGKATTISAYNTAKTATVTVFNKTKTGLSLAKEYAVASAVKAGDFFNSSVNSVSQYFSATAQAQLEFDMSKPLISSYSTEQIPEQIKAVEVTQAAVMIVPDYSAKLTALKKQKAIFAPGEEISFKAEIKNIGSTVWEGEKISLNVYVEMDQAKKFYHSSWLTAVRPASLGKVKIAPGAIGIFEFIATAPIGAGEYFFRVRAVRQDGNNFNWLGEDIASWNIKVKALSAEPVKEIADLPAEIAELVQETGKTGEETLTPENNLPPVLPPEEIIPVADENIEKAKAEAEALAAAEAAKLAEETARLAEESAERRRRARSWAAMPPETVIIEFPEKITAEATANFKFSSSKGGADFLCGLKEAASLKDDEFVSCGEYTVFENLAAGEYILKVKAKDEYGNIDETPAEYSWTIEKEKNAPHLVISEIQAGTDENGAEDEFVELYNPTDQKIVLTGWELRKKNSNGIGSNLVDDGDFNGEIAPKGFFLIAHKNYKGSVSPDLWYSAGNDLSYSDNSAVLYNGDYTAGEIIDEAAYASIPKGQSLERKAWKNEACVSPQGKGEFWGNGCDTDEPSDFEIRLAPDPQNLKSIAEPALTPVHNITSGSDYPAIQWAIDKASAGDELYVDSGAYSEEININKRIILNGIDTGGGQPVINTVSAIFLTADEITVSGFSINGTGVLSNGIYSETGGHTITNNTIISESASIYLYNSDNNKLTGNDLSNGESGLYLDHCDNNVISDNIFSFNKNDGAVLYASNGNMFNGNTIESNTRDGIEIIDSNNNIISKNISSANHNGLVLRNSFDNTVTDNTFSLNRSYGIESYKASKNKIYRNNILSNKIQAYNETLEIFWDNDYPSGGNFWSDYAGVDLNSGVSQDEAGSDGIGDTPYIMFKSDGGEEVLRDRYPLMQEYKAQ